MNLICQTKIEDRSKEMLETLKLTALIPSRKKKGGLFFVFLFDPSREL
jgi:hypothetical protein